MSKRSKNTRHTKAPMSAEEARLAAEAAAAEAVAEVFNNPNLATKILGIGGGKFGNFFVSNVKPSRLTYLVQNGLLKETKLKMLPPDILHLIDTKTRDPLYTPLLHENPLGYHVTYFGAPRNVPALVSKFRRPAHNGAMVAITPSVHKLNQHSRTYGEADARRSSARRRRDQYLGLRATSKQMRSAYNKRGGLNMTLEEKRNLAGTRKI